ncbi:MAG: prepilin-type N-terminal cleavage/methylation domain-containing protein [Pseudomonadota bacterium]
MTSRSNRDAGFTVVEVLVAITVLALITSMAFGVMRFGTQVWDRGQGPLSGPSVHDIGFRFRSLLGRAVLPSVRQSDLSVKVPFRLQSKLLEFLTMEREGLTAWQFVAEPRGSDTRLLVRRARLSGPNAWFQPIDWGVPEFRWTGSGSVTFAAFESGQAVNEWPVGPSAPQIVAMTIKEARSDLQITALLRQAK